MLVRRITPADALLLREVRLRALATDPLAFGSTYAIEAPRSPSAWETWAREHASGADKATFLALRDGTVDAVGVAMGRRVEEPRRFGLFSMWVDGGERRRGTGRALVEAVAAWVRASAAFRPSRAVIRRTRATESSRTRCNDQGGRAPAWRRPGEDDLAARRYRSRQGQASRIVVYTLGSASEHHVEAQAPEARPEEDHAREEASRCRLKAEGREIRRSSLVSDVLIAHTARSLGAAVVTRDADFKTIRAVLDFDLDLLVA